MAESNALSVVQQQARNIQGFLQARHKTMAALLPKHLTPERMVKGLMAAASRNPKILECTQESVLNAMLVCSSLGLEPGRPRGGMHLVPFKNNKRGGRMELTPIPDYRGLMDLAYRSGKVDSIEARAVYEKDDYDYAYGTESFIKHKPSLAPDRGRLVAVYGVAHIKEATRPQFVWLSVADVELTRKRSRAKDDGPWQTDYEAMALKTAVRRLATWIPQASELQTAVEYERRVDEGEGIGDLFDGVIEGSAEDVTGQGSDSGSPGTKTATAAAMDHLGGQDDPPPGAQAATPMPPAAQAQQAPAQQQAESPAQPISAVHHNTATAWIKASANPIQLGQWRVEEEQRQGGPRDSVMGAIHHRLTELGALDAAPAETAQPATTEGVLVPPLPSDCIPGRMTGVKDEVFKELNWRFAHLSDAPLGIHEAWQRLSGKWFQGAPEGSELAKWINAVGLHFYQKALAAGYPQAPG